MMVCRRREVAADRGGRPRLPRRLRLEGIPAIAATVCGIAAAGRPARERPPAGADLHAGDQGRAGRARREHRLRPDGRALAAGCRTATSARARWPRRSATVALAALSATARRSRARRGILLADTKFEFGRSMPDDRRADPHRRGPDAGLVALLGRRGLRARAARRRASTSSSCATGSRRQPGTRRRPGPELPDDVVAGTRARYVEAFERITGASFERYLAGGRRSAR